MTKKQTEYLVKLLAEIIGSSNVWVKDMEFSTIHQWLKEPIVSGNTLWTRLYVKITGKKLELKLANPDGTTVKLSESIRFLFTYDLMTDSVNFNHEIEYWLICKRAEPAA